MTRRICAVTGTRADYGHLSGILLALELDARCELTVVATGGHLSDRHGRTVGEVADGGYARIEEVDIGLDADTPWAIAGALARATERLADLFERLAPDLILVLGDRYEILGAVQAALLLNIPVAHVHGGEITEGAFDDAIRHAVTKMSHLHFAAAEPYARRIRQLGEDPARVFAFGAPGLDHLDSNTDLSLDAIGSDIGATLSDPLLLVTYHPETLGDKAAGAEALVTALETFVARATVLCTGVNADPGHRHVAQVLEAFAKRHPGRVHLVASLGQRRYLSAMRQAAVVVGNSSSGMLEAPALGRPTVNIGHRQDGRLRAASVIDCAAEATAITAAVETALTPAFQARAAAAECPYGRGGASKRIAEVLMTVPLDGLTRKHFHDLPQAAG